MNQLTQVVQVAQPRVIEAVESQKGVFETTLTDDSISWGKEVQFAMQRLQENKFLHDTALRNPESLKSAIKNIATIGISLNPATNHAYLVPRDKKVCLDISYIGLLHLAMLSGAIEFGQARIVYSNDLYVSNGIDLAPTHNYSAFGDRGYAIGAYCTVKTATGAYLTEEMSKDDIYNVRAMSMSYKSGKNSPWITHELEMWRKTVVKRAYKYWPSVGRLGAAIDYLNKNGEGVELDVTPVNTVKEVEQPVNQAVIANAYPEDRFEANFHAWEAAIQKGRLTHEDAITKASMVGQLTKEQINQIKNIAVEA